MDDMQQPVGGPAPEPAVGTPFRPGNLLEQVILGEPALDPSGRWAVYARRTIEGGRYRDRLWRVRTDGGEPVVLAEVAERSWRPRVSPDGTRVVFLAGDAGAGQPWIVTIDGAGARPIASAPGRSRAAEWCADGRHVVALAASGEPRFVVGDPGDPVCRRITDLTWRLDGMGIRDEFTSLWLLDADDAGSQATRLTPPTYEVTAALPMPDGRIAFLADRGPEAGLRERPRLHVVDLGDGSVVELAALPGAMDAVGCASDGRIAIIGNDHPRSAAWHLQGLYVTVDGDGGLRRLGAGLDLQVGNAIYNGVGNLDVYSPPPVWLDETHVVSVLTDHGRSHPWRFGLDGTAVRLVDGETITGAIAAAAGVLVVLASEAGRTAELCRVEDGRLVPITSHGSAWQAPYRRDPVKVVVTHPEGHGIDAWYLRGRGATGPGPFVLEIHGGPNYDHGPLPDMIHVALADAGIGVIWSSPRGSVGYGQAFVPDDLVATHPAASDLVAVLDWAIAEGLADPERLGVTGLSYGGYMTNWLLGHHPGRFRAGVSESPVTDLVAEYGNADIAVFDDLRFPEDLATMQDVSPHRLIHRNMAPLLLIQTDEDMRCPPGQTEIIFRVMRERGVETEMVRYPGESHMLNMTGRPDRRVDRLERIVGWFVRHLVS